MSILDDQSPLDPEERLHWHITRAEIHAERALDMLYGPEKIKRSFLFRARLARAQSSLMTLVVREFHRKSSDSR